MTENTEMAIRLVNDMFGRLREVEKERDRIKAKLDSMLELQSYVDAGVIRVEVDSVDVDSRTIIGETVCKPTPLNDKCDQKLDNVVSRHISGEAREIVNGVPPRVRPKIVPKGALWDYAENGLGGLVAIWVTSNGVKIEDHHNRDKVGFSWLWFDAYTKENWTHDDDPQFSPELYDACKDLYEGNRGSFS